MQGILLLTQPFVSIFVIGAVLGAFSILMIYANQAEKLLSKFTFFAKKFKLLLAIVMLILAILSFINAM
jgi:H+/Cl- antiporter ClcA